MKFYSLAIYYCFHCIQNKHKDKEIRNFSQLIEIYPICTFTPFKKNMQFWQLFFGHNKFVPLMAREDIT